MSDKRTIEFGESLACDFSTNEWVFRVNGEYRVGAGCYYLVPSRGWNPDFEQALKELCATHESTGEQS